MLRSLFTNSTSTLVDSSSYNYSTRVLNVYYEWTKNSLGPNINGKVKVSNSSLSAI